MIIKNLIKIGMKKDEISKVVDMEEKEIEKIINNK